MRFVDRRIESLRNYTRLESFIALCRGSNKRSFTRRRKMPVNRLLLSLLCRKGVTLAMEIRKWTKIFGNESTISKVGYLKQRMKLNPHAITDLCDFYNRDIYTEEELNTRKGYLLLAADGSGINVPTNEETLSAYGTSSKKDAIPQAALGLSCLYDVLNRSILCCSINRVKFSEAKQVLQHLAQVPSVIGSRKYIITLDRGYPSLPLILALKEVGAKFVIRLKASDFKKEQLSMGSMDEAVEIKIDRTRLANYKGTPLGDKLEKLGSISVRMVKIKISDTVMECVATNLAPEEFNTDEVGEIYTMRWRIETVYDILKNKLEVENFTGTKPILIEQDIYSSIYICNLAQDIMLSAQDDIDSRSDEYKHKMSVNCSMVIGILKEDLIFALLQDNPKRRSKLILRLCQDAKKYIIPIRPDRHYERGTKGCRANKFSNTHKRSY